MSFSVTKKAALNVAFIVSLYLPTVLVFYFAISKDYTPLEEYTSLRLLVLLLFMPIILKYIIQLVVAPLYSINEYARSRKRNPNYMPSVSVIIPAHNEEVGILKTLKSVIATKYPNLEIIIANDGSTDRTHDVVLSFIKEHKNISIIYKQLKNGGKSRALNQALAVARNELVVTVDADSVMDKNTIRNIVKHFEDPSVASVAGNVIIGNKGRPIGLIQQLEYMYGFYFKRADSLFNAVYIVGGAAAAYRRELIIKTGGFDNNIITEDIELSTRLQALGYHVRYAPDAIVFTEGPSDFVGLCNQRLRWKYGRLLTFMKHRRLFFSFDKGHKFYLSFLILPVALFAEILLFFEWVLLAIFYTYTIYTNDYIPLAFVITLLAIVIILQVFSDSKIKHSWNLLVFAPVGWLIFYFMDLIEYQALIRSLKRILFKSDLAWQKWKREGVFDEA